MNLEGTNGSKESPVVVTDRPGFIVVDEKTKEGRHATWQELDDDPSILDRAFPARETDPEQKRKYEIVIKSYIKWLRLVKEGLADGGMKLGREQQTLEVERGTDSLTGLPNYRFLKEGVDELVEIMDHKPEKRKHKLGAVMVIMIDLNKLKSINDEYGHVGGNKAVVAFAKHLSNSLKRWGDVLFRFGGDEFVAVLPIDNDQKITDQTLENIFQELKTAVNNGFSVQVEEGVNVPMSAAMGYAVKIKGKPKTSEELFIEADAAMYKDKPPKSR